jgi:hypothetical protein
MNDEWMMGDGGDEEPRVEIRDRFALHTFEVCRMNLINLYNMINVMFYVERISIPRDSLNSWNVKPAS